MSNTKAENCNNSELRARLIAFYLPQFYPIPENDKWWGKGFTEWTNVAKAKPLFRGHYQPHVPADLGFYDLRVHETRIAQAQLAKEHGIEGFCYWHYWFGGGKRLLERPFNEVFKSGEPDFPFCLGWANESWSGVWHGCPDRVLINQTYPGTKDYERHFYKILPALTDERYITIDNKPIFIVYKPLNLPDSIQFTDLWRELACKSGLKDLYLIGITLNDQWSPIQDGFDASCFHNPGITFNKLKINAQIKTAHNMFKLFTNKLCKINKYFFSKPEIYNYRDYIEIALPNLPKPFDQYPCLVPNWDTTPRCGVSGKVLINSQPILFGKHLEDAIKQINNNIQEKRIIFIKSWNEWAEGNYLEPDCKFGDAYLKEIKKSIFC